MQSKEPTFDIRKKLEEALSELQDELKQSILFLDEKSQEFLKWSVPADQIFEQFQVNTIFQIREDEYESFMKSDIFQRYIGHNFVEFDACIISTLCLNI